jgi:phospholipid/cholesterol/gamma-HCH transport system substrate-binding protein
MKLRLTKEQKTGLFALVTLIATYFLVNFLKGQDFFNSNNTYYVKYENVDGLTPTGPVYFKGRKIGTIESIEYVKKSGNFIAKLKINSDYPIPSNSIAMIYSADLLGSKAAKIVPGDSQKFLSNKDTLESGIEAGVIEMLISEVMPLKDSIATLITSLNTTVSGINQILDEKGQANIKNIIAGLNRTINNFEKISETLGKSTPEIEETLKNLKTLSAKLDTAADPLGNTIENFSKVSDELVAADLSGTIKSLKSLLEDMRNPQGSLGKLMTTDSLHTSVTTLVKNLDELIENINNNPKKYIKITVF